MATVPFPITELPDVVGIPTPGCTLVRNAENTAFELTAVAARAPNDLVNLVDVTGDAAPLVVPIGLSDSSGVFELRQIKSSDILDAKATSIPNVVVKRDSLGRVIAKGLVINNDFSTPVHGTSVIIIAGTYQNEPLTRWIGQDGFDVAWVDKDGVGTFAGISTDAIAANTIDVTTANITVGNITTINATTINATTVALTGKITALNHIETIPITFDGLGSVLTSATIRRSVHADATIVSWTLLADQSGSVVIDIKKSTYTGFPTTSSITAAAPPTLSSVQKNTDSTLTGWTTTINESDVLEFVITGTPVSITNVVLSLKLRRT